jgi:hypothetical protein
VSSEEDVPNSDSNISSNAVDVPPAGGGGPGRQGARRGGRGADGVRQPCAFFLKTGSCAYGDRCKFDHPYGQAPRVAFNSLGLPLRPEEPPCSYYLKNYK